jgi:hypothetical protein
VTRLAAREDVNAFIRRESFKFYTSNVHFGAVSCL